VIADEIRSIRQLDHRTHFMESGSPASPANSGLPGGTLQRKTAPTYLIGLMRRRKPRSSIGVYSRPPS
jgi:hypothetical protein